MITSRNNPRIKQTATLRNRKARDARGETLIYGPRETLRAVQAGAELIEAFVCPELLRGADAERAVAALKAAQVVRQETSAEVFEKLAYGDRMDGVIAVARIPQRSLGALDTPTDGLIAVVEGVEKPGNLGALLRSADGAGVDAVLVVDPVIDLFSPNVIRASTGAVFANNIATCSAGDSLAWLNDRRVKIYATRPDATADYTAADFHGAAAVVLGNEAKGLTDTWSGQRVEAIRIPMHGVADSLNLSATAAVLFYEALRQRTPV